jgi:hypothetical protein
MQELIIVVAILIGAVWLLVKVCQALGSMISETDKAIREGINRRKNERFTKTKSRLSPYVQFVLPNQLDAAQNQLATTAVQFKQLQTKTEWIAHPPTWVREEFKTYLPPSKNGSYRIMDIDDLASILVPGSKIWLQKESDLLAQPCTYPFQPPVKECLPFKEFAQLKPNLEHAVFECDESKISQKAITRYFQGEQKSVVEYNRRRSEIIDACDSLNRQIQEWNEKSRLNWESYTQQYERLVERELAHFGLASNEYVRKCKEQKTHFREVQQGYRSGRKDAVIERFNCVLSELLLPASIPRTWDIDFDNEQRILIVEIGLPDVVHHPPFKKVKLKSGIVNKPLNQTERRELIPRVHPAVILRVAYEIFQNDDAEVINLLVLNGWVGFDDPRTGINTKAYTASLMVERNQIRNLNLAKIDSSAAFDNLHGKSAGKLVEIIPIEPMLSLNKKDSRFVDAKAVLGTLGTATNLAAMDWQDFEHLIRELFEKEFAGREAEVKITQASRDRGVDAVVFDPDPIHGGKYVIQAKRYTNTVDVSAVRDLCAVVKKEGASRGILVTTSTYGADAYAFANNEPITLLNGAELLGLLKKHGYSFRINLQEARQSGQANLHKEKSASS